MRIRLLNCVLAGMIVGMILILVPRVASQDSRQIVVLWEDYEPCHECGFRTAMACPPGQPDCNVPTKTVARFERFESSSSALEFINRWFARPKFPVSLYPLSGPLPAGEVLISGTRGRKLAGLFRTIEIPLDTVQDGEFQEREEVVKTKPRMIYREKK